MMLTLSFNLKNNLSFISGKSSSEGETPVASLSSESPSSLALTTSVSSASATASLEAEKTKQRSGGTISKGHQFYNLFAGVIESHIMDHFDEYAEEIFDSLKKDEGTEKKDEISRQG